MAYGRAHAEVKSWANCPMWREGTLRLGGCRAAPGLHPQGGWWSMRRRLRSWITVAAAAVVAAAPVALSSGVVTQAAASTSKPAAAKVTANTRYLNKHAHINCAESSAMCT